jgi:hypothetical protein
MTDLGEGTVSAKAYTDGFAAFGVGAEFAHAVGFFSGAVALLIINLPPNLKAILTPLPHKMSHGKVSLKIFTNLFTKKSKMPPTSHSFCLAR